MVRIQPHLVGLAAVAALMSAGAAQAQHAPPAAAGATRSMADDSSAWRKSPHMQAFYALTKASFANGPGRVDFPTYQEKSYAIFREFAVTMGAKPEAMVDHLKAIPGQMLQIVADDPKALDSFDTFWIAMVGPA